MYSELAKYGAGTTAQGRSSAVREVVALVSREKNVPITLILHQSRCRQPTARARQLAMYLSHVIFGESLTAIGVAFKRDRTTVSYACGLIEDMRDDVGFDREVSRLEELLLAWEADNAAQAV